MEKNQKYFFAICTSPVRANILSRFQYEGKNDVQTSQVRRVKCFKRSLADLFSG